MSEANSLQCTPYGMLLTLRPRMKTFGSKIGTGENAKSSSPVWLTSYKNRCTMHKEVQRDHDPAAVEDEIEKMTSKISGEVGPVE